jgi:phospholipid/cholesterol/gamma-HCH transport system permease protein
MGISVTCYLRVPAFLGAFLAYLLVTLFFGTAMYVAGWFTAQGFFGISDAREILTLTSSGFERHFFMKTVLYGIFVGLIGVHMGLNPQRSSEDVAHSITHSIIYSTLVIVLTELLFASDLHV